MNQETPIAFSPDGSTISSLPGEQFHLALDCLETAFPDMRRGFFHAIVLQDPAYDPRYSLAIRDGERVLSFLHIFRRNLQIGGRLIPFGGIGCVGTRPEYRGRGFARALLQCAIQRMREDGLAGSLLFTGIHPFYETLGWRTLEILESEVSIEQAPPQRLHPTSAPLNEAEIPSLLPMLQQMQNHANIYMPRTAAYWRARPAWMNHPGWTARLGEKLIGYFYACQYKPDRPVLHITEFGMSDDSTETSRALLFLMMEKAKSLKCTAIRGFFPFSPALESFLRENDLIDSHHPHRYMMWLDLGPDLLYERIQQAIHDSEWLYWTTDAF